jgi:hypothetical protein
MEIEWSAGGDGIRQTVYTDPDDGRSLSIILTNEGVIMDLIDKDGEVIGTESATYDEIMEGLSDD